MLRAAVFSWTQCIAVVRCQNKIITGSTARSATHQYLSYSEADFEVRHVAPMGLKFGTEEGKLPLCQISLGATIRV